MQGYGTMASEAAEQLRQLGVNRPSHVFVQAGVGSLAGAVVGYFTNLFPNDPPKFIIMEAQAADCLYRGALAGDGSPRIVDGDLQTIMAGLACGEPNTISWDILRNHATAFVSCPDWVSARGMRMLGVPVKGDPVVISGESGAVGMGLIAAIMETDEYKAVSYTHLGLLWLLTLALMVILPNLTYWLGISEVYAVVVTVAFLITGFLLDNWHPGWMLFLTIPLYYVLIFGR